MDTGDDDVTLILDETRKHPMLVSGSSVRGGIALTKTARVFALIQGRDFVTPDDVKWLAHVTLRHRIRVNPEAQVSNITADNVISEIMEKVAFPQ